MRTIGPAGELQHVNLVHVLYTMSGQVSQSTTVLLHRLEAIIKSLVRHSGLQAWGKDALSRV